MQTCNHHNLHLVKNKYGKYKHRLVQKVTKKSKKVKNEVLLGSVKTTTAAFLKLQFQAFLPLD